MSEDNRWNVDLTDEMSQPITVFDGALHGLIDDADFWGNYGAFEIRDFITKLVHEIERQQTENIRLEDEAKAWRYKHGYVTTELPLMSPPQPFYMEAE